MTRAETAFHEAGHAVVGWFVGHRIQRVTIVPDFDEGSAGAAEYKRGASEPGDTGVRFIWHPTHGIVVEDPLGSQRYRLQTEDERELNLILDHTLEMDEWEAELLTLAAGEAASRIIAPTLTWCGSGYDQERAMEIAPDESWDAWVVRARAFIEQPPVWRRIERLATALLERDALEAADVLGVIRPA